MDAYCDHIIAISEDNAARISITDKCTVVYNFSDFEEFRTDVKPLIDRENDYFYYLYMGGAKKFKGYEVLARSIKHLDWKVRIILAGNFRRMEKKGFIVKAKRVMNRIINRVPEFEKIISDPRVIHVGLSTKVPELIQSCDAVIFPATSTHFPRPLIEGMAMKKIALAFKMEGIEEVIKEGKNGFIIQDKTAVGLANAMNKLARIPSEQQEKMSAFGYEFAMHNFSLKNIDKITSIYEML
jgi:glycosyltransferase involved in cell wall biosynthesis